MGCAPRGQLEDFLLLDDTDSPSLRLLNWRYSLKSQGLFPVKALGEYFLELIRLVGLDSVINNREKMATRSEWNKETNHLLTTGGHLTKSTALLKEHTNFSFR